MGPEEAAVRARLDRDAVVSMAIQLVDAEGIDALTIRRLARDLNVTPTALYWHFADKQALLDALGDRLWYEAQAQVGAPESTEDWVELRAIFEALLSVFRRHPALAALAPFRVIDCEAGLAITERVLGLLGSAGYDEAGSADAARFLLSTVVMLVTSQPGSAVPDEAERSALMRSKRAALLTLPPGRSPHVEASAGFLVDCDEAESDSFYALGVELILSGLKATAERSAATASA